FLLEARLSISLVSHCFPPSRYPGVDRSVPAWYGRLRPSRTTL
ncbi:hypothetical protein CSUI_002803, partial [Cystoisospora suis]